MAKSYNEIFQLDDGPNAGMWKYRTVREQDGVWAVVHESSTVYATESAAERALSRRLEGRGGTFKPMGG